MESQELKACAVSVNRPTELNGFVVFGSVSAAIETVSGNVYTGINIDSACSLGHCAEHSAVAEMLKQGETQIKAAVAVDARGQVIPPCGRCRELFSQLDRQNLNAVIEVAENTFVTLGDLLPYDWKADLDQKWEKCK